MQQLQASASASLAVTALHIAHDASQQINLVLRFCIFVSEDLRPSHTATVVEEAISCSR